MDGNYPKLKMAYDLKEDFFKIWDSKSRLEAYDKYQHWLRRIPDEMRAPFKSIVTAMKNSSRHKRLYGVCE
ncbi:hypothetical protein YDYSG_01970 [Paenibacillus tyrfis]|nr:hypothetical protein YDYSG_01970 [Paenibacillus tyrfis]